MIATNRPRRTSVRSFRWGLLTAGFVLSLAAGFVTFAASNTRVSAIVGGVDSMPGEFTSIVDIQKKLANGTWQHIGSGVLLSQNKVLTAASVVKGKKLMKLRVVAGQYTQPSTAGSTPSPVQSFTVHKDFKKVGFGTKGNDLAMITLKNPIYPSWDIQYATLPQDDSNTFVGMTVQTAGWGRTSCSNLIPQVLQKAQTIVIGTAQANSLLAFAPVPSSVTDHHLPLYEASESIGISEGDEGCAVIALDLTGGSTLIGIGSFGNTSWGGCPLTSFPSVATRVSSYLPWIAANM